MRDQITTGIHNAMDASRLIGTDLSRLGHPDVEMLVEHILEALTTVPDGTPSPAVTVTPAATPMLVLSPADVVARYAMDALTDTQIATDNFEPQPITHQIRAAGPDIREVRELLFRIQHLFGVRIRTNATDGTFIIAGTATQVAAFDRVHTMLRDAAAPVVEDLSTEDQRVFYATLGVLICDHEDGDHLIESNRGLVESATRYLSDEFGPVRSLRRTTPASAGALFDAAAQVAPVATS